MMFRLEFLGISVFVGWFFMTYSVICYFIVAFYGLYAGINVTLKNFVALNFGLALFAFSTLFMYGFSDVKFAIISALIGAFVAVIFYLLNWVTSRFFPLFIILFVVISMPMKPSMISLYIPFMILGALTIVSHLAQSVKNMRQN
jgi:hypothetical protein